MPITYYVVVPFDRDDTGNLMPGAPQEVSNAGIASRRVQNLAAAHAGAVAFSRTGEPASGEFEDAVILSQYGEVDLDALNE